MKFIKYLSEGVGKKIQFALDKKEYLEAERQALQNKISQINAELLQINKEILDDVKSNWTDKEIEQAKALYFQQLEFISEKDKISNLFKTELDCQIFVDKKNNMMKFKEFTLNLHRQFPSHSLEEIEEICLDIYKNNVVD